MPPSLHTGMRGETDDDMSLILEAGPDRKPALPIRTVAGRAIFRNFRKGKNGVDWFHLSHYRGYQRDNLSSDSTSAAPRPNRAAARPIRPR